ncbi:MAG: acylphosphatase, partial [Halarcobacter sp.]
MQTYKIRVKGIVQGVGFRPFVFNLASKYSINGWVNNDEKGVNILLYSSKESIENFIKELKENPPPLSKIDSIEIEELNSKNIYTKFEIKKSETSNNKSTIISPDMSVCQDCIDDIN